MLFVSRTVTMIAVVLAFVSASTASAATPAMSCTPAQPAVRPSMTTPVASNRLGRTLEGDWFGHFSVGATSMWEAYYIHNGRVTRGSAFGSLPEVGRAILVGQRVQLVFGNGRLDGVLDPHGVTVKGTWTASGSAQRSLTLIRHPQTPTSPLPYDSADVSYRSSDGTMIAGTVTSPRTTAKKAAVVLVVGSTAEYGA